MPGEDVVQPEGAAQRLLHEGPEEVPVPRRQRRAPSVEERGGVGVRPARRGSGCRERGTGRSGRAAEVPFTTARRRRPRSARRGRSRRRGTAFRPSTWSVRTATAPSPQATTRDGETEMTVPGGRPTGASATSRQSRELQAGFASKGEETRPRGEGSVSTNQRDGGERPVDEPVLAGDLRAVGRQGVVLRNRLERKPRERLDEKRPPPSPRGGRRALRRSPSRRSPSPGRRRRGRCPSRPPSS